MKLLRAHTGINRSRMQMHAGGYELTVVCNCQPVWKELNPGSRVDYDQMHRSRQGTRFTHAEPELLTIQLRTR